MTITINVHFLVKVKTGPLWFMYNYTTLSTQVPEGTVLTNAYLDTVAHRTVKNYIPGSAVFTTGEVQVDNSTDTLMDDIMNKINNSVEPVDIPEAPQVKEVTTELEQREEDFAKKYLGNWLIKELSNPKVLLRHYIKVDTTDMQLWRLVNKHSHLLEDKGYKVTMNGPNTRIGTEPAWTSPSHMFQTITWGDEVENPIPVVTQEECKPLWR